MTSLSIDEKPRCTRPGDRKDNAMCTFNTSSGCDCPCECDILLREDRDMCPAHGTAAQEAKAQQAQAPRKVSVGRTQPLWEEPSETTAVDEIWLMVEKLYFDGRITSQQRRLFRWAVGKAKEDEVRCGQCGEPAQEL
jgi:hypothetical protein